MPDLLYLSHRIPYPPFKGEKIRPLHIIRHLRDRYRIHLGCLIDDRADWAHVPVVRELCADAYFAPLNPRVAKIACLRGLATGAPLTLPYFWNHGLARWVETVLTEVKPEVVLIFSSAMAQYVLPHLRQVPLSIMDFADVDSDKWLKYAETTRWPMSWIYGRESRRLLACEREPRIGGSYRFGRQGLIKNRRRLVDPAAREQCLAANDEELDGLRSVERHIIGNLVQNTVVFTLKQP